jgi:hypothetical protein
MESGLDTLNSSPFPSRDGVPIHFFLEYPGIDAFSWNVPHLSKHPDNLSHPSGTCILFLVRVLIVTNPPMTRHGESLMSPATSISMQYTRKSHNGINIGFHHYDETLRFY